MYIDGASYKNKFKQSNKPGLRFCTSKSSDNDKCIVNYLQAHFYENICFLKC